jgi:hypothetical protein
VRRSLIPASGKAGGRKRATSRARFVLCLAALLFSGAGSAFAGSRAAAETAFREGVRLYQQDRVMEALSEWRAALDEGYASADLYLNLGNACYRAGETGWAVYYYELARRRAPADPDVAANLALARREVAGGEIEPASAPWLLFLAGRLDHVSLRGAAWFGVAALWAVAALLLATWLPGTARLFRRPRALRWMALACGVAAATLLGLKSAQRSFAPDAIAVRALTAHTEPSDEAAVEFRLPEGSPIGLGREAPGWREVIVSHSLRGWVPEEAVALF